MQAMQSIDILRNKKLLKFKYPVLYIVSIVCIVCIFCIVLLVQFRADQV